VSLPASVAGRERVRLFCALRLPGHVLDTLVAWQADHVPEGRIVPRENLHITLAFLGHRPVGEVGAMAAQLREAAAASGPIRLVPERYRETRSVAMLVLSDLAGTASRLAEDLFTRLEQLGAFERERRAWVPHVTVLRFHRAPRLAPPLPELAEVVPSDAAVYLSQLRPTGAQYVVVESFALGG